MEPSATTGIARISRIFAWLGGLLVLVAALLISLDVLTRNILGSTFFESFELGSYAFAACVALGMSYALTSKAHIRIEVVYSLFPRRFRVVLDVMAIMFLAVAASVLAWFAAQTVYDSYSIGAHSNTTLAVPLVLPQGLWLAGLGWFALTTVWLAASSLLHLSHGRPDLVLREIGVPALQEEILQSSTDANLAPIDIVS